MTKPITLLDDAFMARMAGGAGETRNIVPFAPGPVILPRGTGPAFVNGTQLPEDSGSSFRPIVVGPCPNPDANG